MTTSRQEAARWLSEAWGDSGKAEEMLLTLTEPGPSRFKPSRFGYCPECGVDWEYHVLHSSAAPSVPTRDGGCVHSPPGAVPCAECVPAPSPTPPSGGLLAPEQHEHMRLTGSVVLNPEAIGDPYAMPVVQLSPEVAASFRSAATPKPAPGSGKFEKALDYALMCERSWHTGDTSAQGTQRRAKARAAVIAAYEAKPVISLEGQAVLDEANNEIVRLRAEVEFLKGEVKAAETRSGVANVVAQMEAQIEAERKARIECDKHRLDEMANAAKAHGVALVATDRADAAEADRDSLAEQLSRSVARGDVDGTTKS